MWFKIIFGGADSGLYDPDTAKPRVFTKEHVRNADDSLWGAVDGLDVGSELAERLRAAVTMLGT